MKTTIIIDSNSIQAKQLIEYIKTLPFAKVVDNKKNTLEEATAEYGSVSVVELDDKIKEHFKKSHGRINIRPIMYNTENQTPIRHLQQALFA